MVETIRDKIRRLGQVFDAAVEEGFKQGEVKTDKAMRKMGYTEEELEEYHKNKDAKKEAKRAKREARRLKREERRNKK